MNIPFHKPYITDEEITEVVDVLKSGWLTTGSKCFEFEKAFTDYIGCKYAIAVNSGTAALHLALEAIGLRERDIVLTTTMTFAATAEVVRYFNAKPEFIDINPQTMNMDVTLLEDKVKALRAGGANVKAIIPVHMAGYPCDMDSITALANKYDIRIIEDAAHALPCKYKNRMIGNISDLTCFSFYANKNITTGEGGMVATNNPEWAARIRIMSLHGISKDAWKRYTAEGNWYYEIVAPGYKYNMTDLAGAIGKTQLKRADYFLERRADIADNYSKAFDAIPQLSHPTIKDDIQHSWHLYIIQLKLEMLTIDRGEFIEELKNRGIGTSVHFIPLHIHPYYRDTYGYKPEDFPIAYDTYKKIITLPIYPKMSDEDISRVIEAVIEVVITFKK